MSLALKQTNEGGKKKKKHSLRATAENEADLSEAFHFASGAVAAGKYQPSPIDFPVAAAKLHFEENDLWVD